MHIDAKTIDVLRQMTFDGNVARLPKTQLPRALYQAVNKVLVALGGKWSRKYQGHLFPNPPGDLVRMSIVSGEVMTAQDLGFFKTPQDLAKRLVELAEIIPEHTVLEPSAGNGRIAMEILAVTEHLTMVEINPHHDATLIRMCLETDARVVIEDFLEPTLVLPMFDRIVMNPPFFRSAHIDHVYRAFELLNPGGILVTVLPVSVDWRQDKKHRDFRLWYTKHNAETWVNAPDTFKSSGTKVDTMILKIKKEGE